LFFFFVSAAVLAVLFVFDSPAIDYRFVALGGVLPLAEAATGRPLLFHTLLGSVGLMTAVMALTIGRRLLRRRLLGVPIGTFVFLVAAGSWTRRDLFWWPVGGLDGIELLGIGALVWLVRRFDLTRPEHRGELLRTGRLPKMN
jgi:hypothetical protein